MPGGGQQPNWSVGNWLTLNNKKDPNNWNADVYIKKSVLWPYCGGSVGIWHCPADRSTAIDNKGQTVPRIRSMSMSCWVGGPGWGNSGPWRPASKDGWLVYLKQSDMVDPGPAGTFVLLDERNDSINDGYYVVDMQGYSDQPNRMEDRRFPVQLP